MIFIYYIFFIFINFQGKGNLKFYWLFGLDENDELLFKLVGGIFRKELRIIFQFDG